LCPQGFTALKETVLVVAKGTAGLNAILNVREKFKSPSNPPTLSPYACTLYDPARAVTAFAQSVVGASPLFVAVIVVVVVVAVMMAIS
jgi:hypothetical protein